VLQAHKSSAVGDATRLFSTATRKIAAFEATHGADDAPAPAPASDEKV